MKTGYNKKNEDGFKIHLLLTKRLRSSKIDLKHKRIQVQNKDNSQSYMHAWMLSC